MLERDIRWYYTFERGCRLKSTSSVKRHIESVQLSSWNFRSAASSNHVRTYVCISFVRFQPVNSFFDHPSIHSGFVSRWRETCSFEASSFNERSSELSSPDKKRTRSSDHSRKNLFSRCFFHPFSFVLQRIKREKDESLIDWWQTINNERILVGCFVRSWTIESRWKWDAFQNVDRDDSTVAVNN